ncbi:MAG: NAD(P)-dependent oxidoreductase [Actinomycetota bacterium]|jgi:3-hydroxyisobutyrate dehydrogenase-like beta-hydroxyacid dehydrogenase|nr:NAD(P)-dependent oxidoreductase [Actinomycetota bacterium]
MTSANHPTTAFIGLGVMGYPMAGHLHATGYPTRVYNRTATKSTAWADKHGVGGNSGTAHATPAEAATGASVVFLCVGADDDVRSVVYGDDGVLGTMEAGSVLVDHTTASAELARELDSACRSQGVGFVDAPVSGGQAGAENGVLTVMCGGDQAAFDTAQPIIDAYSRACTLLGPAGSGQLTKMVNQICIAGLVQALSEGLEFGRRAGLDLDLVIDTISQGAAGSWQMENRGRTMARDEFDFGFAVDWMRKDLGIVLREGDRNGAPLAITAMVDQYYKAVQEHGGNRWDTSSLISLLR